MTDHIKTLHKAGVLTLVLSRPDKKNALTDAMYGALADRIEQAGRDPEVRVLLIRGEGDMFSAGNDVAEFAAAAASGQGLNNVWRFLEALSRCERPIVAAVHGRAVGVGTTLLLHCDHVVLSEDAVLTTPFVNLALVPEAASSLLLPARIGHVRAFQMFALGEPVKAADALAWGLANTVVPRGALDTTADSVARRLAAQPLAAIMATKRLMRPDAAVSAQMEREGVEFRNRLGSPEAKEAFSAFAERRSPNFTQFA